MEYSIKDNGQYESIEFNSDVVQTKGNVILQAKIDNDNYANYKSINGSKVTKIDLPETVDLKLVSSSPFTYSIPGVEPHYYKKTKIEDYLYEITYGNIDYEYAYNYFNPVNSFGCSSIRNGKFFGRNFDWLYNNQVQFIVHTPTSFERLAVLGVSGIIPGVEQSNVDDDEIIIDGVNMFKLVPFYLLDGINERGVFCTHNVVPLDDETSPTREIIAKREEKDRVCIPMLPRFILDRFTSAEQAINYLINYTTLYFTDTMIDSGYQSHFLLGDSNSTYIIEFRDSKIEIINAKYITNFNINNVIFNSDNTVLYPPTEFGINKYGTGLERWNIISKNYSQANTLQGMRNLLELIKYSNTYSSTDFWYSELVKMLDTERQPITVDTPPDKCGRAKAAMLSHWRLKDRNNPKVWITCHSSIYDISRKILYVRNQENETEYEFRL